MSHLGILPSGCKSLRILWKYEKLELLRYFIIYWAVFRLPKVSILSEPVLKSNPPLLCLEKILLLLQAIQTVLSHGVEGSFS